MIDLTTVLVGALVSCASYLVNIISERIANNSLRPAVKALVTLVMAVALGTLQLLLQGQLSWANLWESLPLIISAASIFYGLILKPATAGM